MAQTTQTSETKRTVLGSGDIYLTEVEGTIDTSDIDVLIDTYFVEKNRFGDTKNGATFTWTPTKYTVEDDLGRVVETYLTKEEVKLGFGTVTTSPDMLASIIETVRKVTTTKGRTALKIGGVSNASNKSYFAGFRHINKKKGDIFVMIIGKNEGELSFNFQPETETILNPTFTAQAMDLEGTKVIIAFDKPAEETAGGTGAGTETGTEAGA